VSAIEKVHGSYVARRRIQVLAEHLAGMLPPNVSVLDVGCGDGSLAKLVQDLRPDVRMRGIDVLVRPQTAVPVEPFDGTHIPAADGSYDVVMFVDVLHHTNDPLVLLREARRVARHGVLLKDHTRNGLLAGPTLRFMDGVGNARYGVALPYNYWRREQWLAAFRELGLNVEIWQPNLGLYPAWANWLFGRSLHFIARAGVSKSP
jgi:SAM-dependent methyltransferase